MLRSASCTASAHARDSSGLVRTDVTRHRYPFTCEWDLSGVGHSHVHRPYVSRRDFLKRAAALSAATAAGPFFWRQLAYAADVPPAQVHLTFGRDAASAMHASWMTAAPVDGPFVELLGSRVAARTVQYPGYPGYFHHADLSGLPAATEIAYSVGHAGRTVDGTAASFTTGPPARQPFTFSAFGDQGTDEPPGFLGQPPFQPSMNTELARSMDPRFHVIVGDLAYANGDQAIWDQWFSMIEPMARTTPWMPVIGNHEIESQLTGSVGDSWGPWGYDPYRTRFALPSNGFDDLHNCYYAFRYGGVHFVCIDNNDVNEEVTNNIGYTGGRQQAFVERELAAARLDPTVDFIVVVMHQCAFSSSSKHGSDPGVQKAWFDLFHRHSVDLVLQGHDHTYERTHGMVGDEVVQDGPIYRTDVGTVYVVCGNGGAVQEPFNPAQPAWSAFRQELKVGTLKIEVQPDAGNGMKRLLLSEHWALDGSLIEGGIVLERPIADVRAQSANAAAVPASSTAAPAADATAPRPSPVETLPATGGPGGAALIGIAAAAGGLVVRTLTREERVEEWR